MCFGFEGGDASYTWGGETRTPMRLCVSKRHSRLRFGHSIKQPLNCLQQKTRT